MHISFKGDYALKTTLELTLHYGNGVVTIHDLAKRLDIPLKFLEQILLDLKRGGFVQSRRGKVGGYLLARPPSQIKLGEVIRFIDGPLEPIACTGKKYTGCNDIYKCALRKVWQDVAQATAHIVDNLSFEDLAKRESRLDAKLVYQI